MHVPYTHCLCGRELPTPDCRKEKPVFTMKLPCWLACLSESSNKPIFMPSATRVRTTHNPGIANSLRVTDLSAPPSAAAYPTDLQSGILNTNSMLTIPLASTVGINVT